MTRALKFRAWANGYEKWCVWVDYHVDLWIGTVNLLNRNYTTTDVTVEQYTGLKDKNGKEVYEGDIIKYDGVVYTIVWNEEYMGFDLTRVGNMHLGVPMNVIITCGSVIGNIHENPELLGGKE